jgi:hypothetical protein
MNIACETVLESVAHIGWPTENSCQSAAKGRGRLDHSQLVGFKMEEDNKVVGGLVDFAFKVGGAFVDGSSAESPPPTARFEVFRSKQNDVYAAFKIGTALQTWPVRSGEFGQWLVAEYHNSEGKTARSAELKAAIDQIEADATLFGSPVHDVFMRVGQLGDRLYLDLANQTWSAIEIDAAGWRVVHSPPVRFVRTKSMLPMPTPQAGGSMGMLSSLINAGDQEDCVLVVAWLLAALRRDIPKPVLAIQGGEGSAKSSLVEILCGLIDPHDSPYGPLPRNELKLRLAARTAYCPAFDNVSVLPSAMSDALCRFVTDGSNQPVILDGLSRVVARPDLADRCLFIDCTPISDVQRRTQREVATAFSTMRPQIMGALLDAVVHGLQAETQVRPAGLPRMADFASWVTACERALWPSGTFRKAYDLNRVETAEALVGLDVVAAAVRRLVGRNAFWQGTAGDLDDRLRALSGNLDTKDWPAEPRLLANRLRALAPSLLKTGVIVTFHRSQDRMRTRLITITANAESETDDDSPQTGTGPAAASGAAAA